MVETSNAYRVSRIALALVWIYHGLIPKILFSDAQEIEMNARLMPFLGERTALLGIGLVEILYGLLLLVLFRRRWPLYVTLFFSVVSSVVLLIYFGEYFHRAFNPFSLNVSVFSLALINYMTHQDQPTRLF